MMGNCSDPSQVPPQIVPVIRALVHLVVVVLVLVAVLPAPRAWAQRLGPVDGADPHDRMQSWLIPTPDATRPARALLYLPPGDGPFRLALIAHGSSDNPLRRAQMPQPVYPALATFLVARGFAVLVPQRLGHGRTGGPYFEDQGGCDDAQYARAGRATAEQIMAALRFMREQPFIAKAGAVVVGHSAGGWGALALADHDPRTIAGIIVFAAGRGGHADDMPGRICAPDRLLIAARDFGAHARAPVTWLVAANDSYFPPAFSRRLADAFRDSGGKVSFVELPAIGDEGHALIERDAGVASAAEALDHALKLNQTPKPSGAAKAR